MNHKRLEQKLKEKNKQYLIRLIETLEKSPEASELIIENSFDISGSPVIDGMIVKYLKSIGVKVRYIKNIEEEKKILLSSQEFSKKNISMCNDSVHFIDGDSTKSRRDEASRIKAPVFIVGDDYYVVCAQCMDFEKL